MGKYVEVDAIREKLIEYISLTNGFDRAFAEVPTIDVVDCKECKHKTYCYGDVLWTNKRQTVDIHKAVKFCSFGEKETK